MDSSSCRRKNSYCYAGIEKIRQYFRGDNHGHLPDYSSFFYQTIFPKIETTGRVYALSLKVTREEKESQ